MAKRELYRKPKDRIRMEASTDREEWLRKRRHTVGGSEAGAVMGESDYADAYVLWCEKTGRTELFAGNDATRLGTELEDLTARLFCEQMEKERGRPVRVRRVKRTMFNLDYPQAHANVDREVVGEHAVLECKTVGMNAPARSEALPRAWYWQLQHYMAVGNYGKGYLAVLDRTGRVPLRVEEVARSDEDIERLMRAEQAFKDCLDNDIQPQTMSGITRDTEVNRRRWPHGDLNASEMRLGDEWDELLDERARLKDGIRTMEKGIRAVDAQLQTVMGDHTRAQSGRYSVSWREQAIAAIDCDALKRDHPDIRPEDYRMRSRILRVSEKKK